MPMSYKTLNRKRGTIKHKGMTINVRVLGIKESYGRKRYLVTPASGSDTAWMEKVALK